MTIKECEEYLKETKEIVLSCTGQIQTITQLLHSEQFELNPQALDFVKSIQQNNNEIRAKLFGL